MMTGATPISGDLQIGIGVHSCQLESSLLGKMANFGRSKGTFFACDGDGDGDDDGDGGGDDDELLL